ncbi:Caffeoylshikimate esterase-like protein [Drosera capensis]
MALPLEWHRKEREESRVTLPFYVLHGEADTVTDPEVSKALYEKASSKDKTIKLYPGMWHALTAGEPDENIEMVFNDIFAWLNKRTSDDYNGEPSTLDHEEMPISEFALATPSGSLHGRQRQQQRGGRSYGNYLCGLKGKSMQRHSSM